MAARTGAAAHPGHLRRRRRRSIQRLLRRPPARFGRHDTGYGPVNGAQPRRADARGGPMPAKKSTIKNRKQYEALKDKGMSKERAARIANSKDASKHGERSGARGTKKS